MSLRGVGFAGGAASKRHAGMKNDRIRMDRPIAAGTRLVSRRILFVPGNPLFERPL